MNEHEKRVHRAQLKQQEQLKQLKKRKKAKMKELKQENNRLTSAMTNFRREADDNVKIQMQMRMMLIQREQMVSALVHAAGGTVEIPTAVLVQVLNEGIGFDVQTDPEKIVITTRKPEEGFFLSDDEEETE